MRTDFQRFSVGDPVIFAENSIKYYKQSKGSTICSVRWKCMSMQSFKVIRAIGDLLIQAVCRLRRKTVTNQTEESAEPKASSFAI